MRTVGRIFVARCRMPVSASARHGRGALVVACSRARRSLQKGWIGLGIYARRIAGELPRIQHQYSSVNREGGVMSMLFFVGIEHVCASLM